MHTKTTQPQRSTPPAARINSTPLTLRSEAATSDRVEVSIIVPLFNRVDMTQMCMVALSRLRTAKTFEVIIVDNGSVDATSDFLEQLEGDVTIISNPVNRGFAAACNQGAACASGSVLVFLNNDVEVDPDWLDPLISAFYDDPTLGITGSLLTFPDGSVQHAGVHLVDRMGSPLVAEHLFYRASVETPGVTTSRPCSAVTGASMAVRWSTFAEVGGFDEGYWNGYEDVDLCLAAGARGWGCAYTPDSRAVHYESQSGPERWSAVTENTLRLLARWVPRVVPDILARRDVVPHPARSSRAAAAAWRSQFNGLTASRPTTAGLGS